MMDLDLVLDVTADKSVLKWSEGIVPRSVFAFSFTPLRGHLTLSQLYASPRQGPHLEADDRERTNKWQPTVLLCQRTPFFPHEGTPPSVLTHAANPSCEANANTYMWLLLLQVAKAINDVYKTFNTGSFPCVVADFQLPSGASTSSEFQLFGTLTNLLENNNNNNNNRRLRRQCQSRQTHHLPPQRREPHHRPHRAFPQSLLRCE